ncbi:MAG TPA: acyl-CoA thioesterase domain-containing protein [Brevibacterium sp.]|nr:acyl-CoA thioesterase domain-containing protein [Brevibacterium sp.]
MPAALNHHIGADGETVPHAYFVRTGASSFRSTLHSQGAWQAGEQHMAAASGLVIHELERALPSDRLISRITFDILGVIHSGEFDIEVDVVRPGRTIELVEARMVHRAEHTGAAEVPATDDRPARPAVPGEPRTSVTARVWRLVPSDTSSVAGAEVESLPAPGEAERRDMSEVWPGGYIGSLTGAEVPGGRPGRRRIWVQTDVPLVDGEPDGAYAGFVKYCDGMNGFAVREDPQRVFFPNVDLTLHLMRQPVPGPVGADIDVAFGDSGIGVTHGVFHDERGPVAHGAQSLTVRLPQGSQRADRSG